MDDDLPDPVEQIPLPEPVPDDTGIPIIILKNNKITKTTSTESPDATASNVNDEQSKSTVRYAIFDPSGLKSELDKYKEEVKKLRKDNYTLKIRNQTLRNEKAKLSKKVEVRDKLMETRRRKAKKDIETISKLRVELSKLRQLRNKMRRREYNRKAKHEKVLERRKKRRQFIQQQIDLGVMDKSQLSLVYSRKKLPYERKNTHIQVLPRQDYNVASYNQIPISMEVGEHPSQTGILPTPTVEYIIEHDGQVENSQMEGETLVEVGNYYEGLAHDGVTENETNAAVAGISNNSFHNDMVVDKGDTDAAGYGTTYVSVSNEHRYTTSRYISEKKDNKSKSVSIVQLQSPLKSNLASGTVNLDQASSDVCSAENLDFIVKVYLKIYLYILTSRS